MQVQVLDDKNVRRRFRASNYQVSTAAVAATAAAAAYEGSRQQLPGSSQ
jgi:hypothetical protein